MSFVFPGNMDETASTHKTALVIYSRNKTDFKQKSGAENRLRLFTGMDFSSPAFRL